MNTSKTELTDADYVVLVFIQNRAAARQPFRFVWQGAYAAQCVREEQNLMRETDPVDASIMADLQNTWHIAGPYPHHAMMQRAFIGISQDYDQIEEEIARAECYAEQRAARLREELGE